MDKYMKKSDVIAYIRKEAKEAQSAFDEMGGESGIIFEAFEDLANELEDFPAVSVPQWISVKDRLPEDGEDVLIWYEYFRYFPYNRMYTTHDIAYQYNGYWEDAGGSLGPKARVFAWMPLPEPPKGENDG